MQWVGAAILIGLLALLLIGGALLAKSEKTPNGRSRSPYEDQYKPNQRHLPMKLQQI
jgi:hypothetical protein